MSGTQRHTEPLDVHLIALRDGASGPEVLLSRRAGDVYAAGCWHLVSGHLDGPWEDMVAALVREAREESGVVIARADVRAAVTVHHRAPAGGARLGVFFEVRRWEGTPQVMEPNVCDAMDWFSFDALPEPMVAYCRAGLDTYRAHARMGVHFQEPGDPIAYEPSVDRLVLVRNPPRAARSRSGRCARSPSRRSGGSPRGRTCPGRGRRAACGGQPVPKAASGTSRSTRRTASTNAKWTPCAAGSPASVRPRPA
ncbi:NUDIX domain-containing protein [Streptomyces sp. JV185]|uniref:NUDIX hydrolase n=1 Tax=Streptomyces sp. JV185 TaxID=858638 RepID=UPI002E78997F|nr:NUDIX domain-containing protein [Streptomyces sp. JV185]MEE1769058.1 NUDIX domain-containing protein [Streptomyces sp. JV185]